MLTRHKSTLILMKHFGKVNRRGGGGGPRKFPLSLKTPTLYVKTKLSTVNARSFVRNVLSLLKI